MVEFVMGGRYVNVRNTFHQFLPSKNGCCLVLETAIRLYEQRDVWGPRKGWRI